MTNQIYYRLADLKDPEERLEDAAMWKALHDYYGQQIKAVSHNDIIPENSHVFGRGKLAQSYGTYCDYWNDLAFLFDCNREFGVYDFKGAIEAVNRLHKRQKGAFVKSTKPKQFAKAIPAGTTFHDQVGEMAYSFMDNGKCLMVQELCRIEFEQRFLFIENEFVTSSPVAWHLTPLDTGILPAGAQYYTPSSIEYTIDQSLDLTSFAKSVQHQCNFKTVGIDCAWINGKPGVIEFNDFYIGGMGLYACDVHKIAAATKLLLNSNGPRK